MPYIANVYLAFMETYDSDLMDLHVRWGAETPGRLDQDPALMRRALSESSPVALIQQILYRATGETLTSALEDVEDTGSLFEKGRIVAASGQHNLAHALFSKALKTVSSELEFNRVLLNFLASSSDPREARALFDIGKESGIKDIYHAYAQYLIRRKMDAEADAILEEGMQAGDRQSYMLAILWLIEKGGGLEGFKKVKNIARITKILTRGTLAGLRVAEDVRDLAAKIIPSTDTGNPVNMAQAYGVSELRA